MANRNRRRAGHALEFDELKTYLDVAHGGRSQSCRASISRGDDRLEDTRPRLAARQVETNHRRRARRTEPDEDLAFAPRTIGLYPTQLYETVSMVLLILLLLAYYPFRRHDGQLMVVLMIGYAVHRFINESLRIEPSYALGLTLSQWGSVVVLAAAIGIEIFLWRTMPSRWKSQTRHARRPSGAKA